MVRAMRGTHLMVARFCLWVLRPALEEMTNRPVISASSLRVEAHD